MPADRLIISPKSVVQCTRVGEARAYCCGKPCVVRCGDNGNTGTYILRQTVFVDIPVRITAHADNPDGNKCHGGGEVTVECCTHTDRRISIVSPPR